MRTIQEKIIYLERAEALANLSGHKLRALYFRLLIKLYERRIQKLWKENSK